jgi:hypothetical protein
VKSCGEIVFELEAWKVSRDRLRRPVIHKHWPWIATSRRPFRPVALRSNRLSSSTTSRTRKLTEVGCRVQWDEEHTLGARFQNGRIIELCGSVLEP